MGTGRLPAAPARIQAANVSPAGAAHDPLSRRRQITGASMARAAQCCAGSATVVAGGRVTGGQVRRTDLSRAEAQRVSAPAWCRELAKRATSGGPSACAAAQRDGMSGASPASRQTCMLALLHIICVPPGPIAT